MNKIVLTLLLLPAILVAKKNIVFIITEDETYQIGKENASVIQTPHLDAFTASGTEFSRAYALSPVCSPSKMALLSGTFPHTNSAYRNVRNYGTKFPLPDKDPSDLRLGGIHEDLATLPELFQENGIYAGITSKTHTQPVRKFQWSKGYGNLNSTRTPKGVRNIMNEFIADAGDQPFFLWLNIAAPHLPMRIQQQANKKWDPTGGLLGKGGATNVSGDEVVVPAYLPDVPAVRQDVADYLGNLETIDDIYAVVHETLKKKNLLDNTLVVYTSDHGWGFHRAKQSIYNAGLNVPLTFAGPGVKAGQKIDAPVSHLDIAPTILDFYNIPQPSSMIGKSLLPIITGKQNNFPDRPTVLIACHEKYDARGVTDGTYYYIENIRKPKGGGFETRKQLKQVFNDDQINSGVPWFNNIFPAVIENKDTHPMPYQLLAELVHGTMPDTELYNIDQDPWNINNLIEKEKYTQKVNTMKKELAAWRAKTDDYQKSPTELQRRTTPRVPGSN